jgi:hypothetical protein
MSRTNKTISGVFVNIVGNSNEFPMYDRLIKEGETLNTSSVLKQYTQKYNDLIEQEERRFRTLANLEEIILQMRVMENLDVSQIKLSVTRGYIYARCPFYRREHVANNVTTIVGLTDIHGDHMELLMNDPEFMNKSLSKLKQVMEEDIKTSINKYKTNTYDKV